MAVIFMGDPPERLAQVRPAGALCVGTGNGGNVMTLSETRARTPRAARPGAWRAGNPRPPGAARPAVPPWQRVWASGGPSGRGRPVPHAMAQDATRAVPGAWRAPTRRSVEAGFDICEIHGAHGYLI